MKLLFVMDPHSQMHPQKDTSFAFMRGAQRREHECFHALVHEVCNAGEQVFAWARSILVADAPPHVQVGERALHRIEEFEVVVVRKDPPFNSAYLHLTQQLDLVKDQLLIVNGPAALRDANEKLFAFHFMEFMPRSLVSSDTQQLLEFVQEVGDAVVKPLDGAGGAGVMRLSSGGRSSRGILDYATKESTELALVQQFLPEVVGGDKRVLLLDGELLGAIRRVPRADDIRANIHVGGTVEACDLTGEEQQLVEALGPQLRQRQLYFVGLDLIGGKLIEINVTSPTGIQELGRLTGTSPENTVVAWMESRVATARRS